MTKGVFECYTIVQKSCEEQPNLFLKINQPLFLTLSLLIP